MTKFMGSLSENEAAASARATDLVAVASGVALHSGLKSRVQLRRTTGADAPLFESRIGEHTVSAPALISRLSGTARATALVLRGPKHLRCELRTVEHYLAALYVMGLDPLVATVESTGPNGETGEAFEMPILDGSAQKWLEILSVFSIYRPAKRKAWKLVRSFEVRDDDKFVCLSPTKDGAPHLDISCSVDFGHSWQQSSHYTLCWDNLDRSLEDFKRRIGPARTFGFAHELEALRKRGLALGGSMDNAILLDANQVVNPGGFVVEDELSAHKLLDVVGDFALLGKPLIARIETFKSGHSMHVRAAQEAIKTGALIEVEMDASGKISGIMP